MIHTHSDCADTVRRVLNDDSTPRSLPNSAIRRADYRSSPTNCVGESGEYESCRSLYHLVGTASDTSARAALRSRCRSHCGRTLSPIAPTDFSVHLNGKPSTHAAIRAAWDAAKSDGSLLIKLKKLLRGDAEQSCVCLVLGISVVGSGAPSIRPKL